MMFRIMGQIITYIYIYLFIYLFIYSVIHVYMFMDVLIPRKTKQEFAEAGSHVWACFMFSTQRICHTDLTHAGLEAQQVCC